MVEVIKSLGKNLLTGAHPNRKCCHCHTTCHAWGIPLLCRSSAAPLCPGPQNLPLPPAACPPSPAGNLDLLKVSLPVKMFEPRSYLQKLADPWVYPRFLRLAAECHDPLERLQWVVTYFIAGGWRDGCLPVPV